VLKYERIKGILVKELVGAEAKNFYQLGRCEFVNNTTCDNLFVSNQPNQTNQPPFIAAKKWMEIWKKVILKWNDMSWI
jgi:hypothetical protein